MKFFSVRLALLLALALLAFGCNGKRVAVVNTDMVYQGSVANEKGLEYLKSISGEMQKAYEEAQAKVDEAKGKKEKEAAQTEMQQLLMEMQQRLNAEQQQVVGVLSQSYKDALESCRTKGKYDIIIQPEATLSYDPQIDITRQVIDAMNAMTYEFKPLAAEEPALEAGADKPAQ